jgi:O-acetyl-ADP-ribose deacetylase (regulator of RNase III)
LRRKKEISLSIYSSSFGFFSHIGGKEVQEECQRSLETKPQKQLDEGELFYSSSGTLKFKMVAHIPGKKWEDKPEISEKERKLFIKMVITSLAECGKKKYESVAIPALCSGNNEYPIKISTLWIVEAINEFLKTNGKQTSIRNIYLCDINRVAVDGFVNTLGKYFALVYNRP